MDGATQDPHLVVLVLRILATFDMKGMQLLPFIHDVAATYLDNSNPVIRQQAVQTCTAVMAHYTDPATSPPRGNNMAHHDYHEYHEYHHYHY